MNGISRQVIRTIATLTCLSATSSFAKDAVVETVLDTFTHARGVAVRPGGTADHYEVYVSDAGTYRILRFRNDDPSSQAEVVNDFQAENTPAALCFLSRDHLVVGCDGPSPIRMYELADQAEPQSADNAKQTVELADKSALEVIFAFGRTRPNDKVADLLIVTGMRADSAGFLGKIPIRAGTLDKMTQFSSVANGRVPHGVAVGEQGFIAVSESVSSADSSRTVLTFYDPAKGVPVISIPIALHDVLDLAYHPTNDNLYALDYGPGGQQGGVYRLDDVSQPGKPECKAVKIVTVNNPTAMAFAPDGALYITRAMIKRSQLLRVRGDL